MKNITLKYYIIAFTLCSTLVMFAQPSADDTGGVLEFDGDTTPVAIDNFVWVLAIIGLIVAFIKFRAIQNKRIQENRRE
jgi:hypothetical protein